MYKFFKISIILAVLFCSAANARQLSISDAVKAAIENNPDIAAAKSALDSAKAKIPQMLSLENPKIGLEYEQIPSGSRNLEDGMKMYAFEQMIMFPGKIYADYLMALKEAEIYRARYSGKILEISSAVKAAYYDLFFVDRSVETLREVKNLLMQMKKAAISRYTVGNAPQTDALLANIEYLLMNNELQIMQQDRKAKEAELKSLLNQTDGSTFETDAALNLPTEIEKEDNIRKAALEMRPELLAMKAEIGMKDAQNLKDKMEFFPDMGFGVKKRAAGGWDAMISLSVPLYFWKQGYGVSSSGSGKSAVEASYRNMKNMTIFEVKESSVMANTALQTVRLYKNEIIPQSLNAFKVSLSAYKGGRIDFQAVLQIERGYKEAKLKLYENQVKYGKALASLEKLKGEETK